MGGEAAIEPQEYGTSGAWQFMRFYPENLTVNVGDRVIWKLASSEPHTVTFLAPGESFPDLIIPEGNESQRLIFNNLVILPQGGSIYDGSNLTGSGQMDVTPEFPKEYNLTFAKPGTFEYICAFHSMMKGNITVQPAGAPYPMTQEQIDVNASKLLAEDTEAALKAVPRAENVSARLGPNGTTIYRALMGYGDGRVVWMRFVPTNLTIKAGDSVEWVQGDIETPHTVTFLSGAEEPEVVVVEPQQGGEPKLVLNSEALMPAGGNVYSGKGYFNSGFIWGTEVPLPGPRNYTLTFDMPGAYEYICVLHDYMGMKGRVVVLPR